MHMCLGVKHLSQLANSPGKEDSHSPAGGPQMREGWQPALLWMRSPWIPSRREHLLGFELVLFGLWWFQALQASLHKSQEKGKQTSGPETHSTAMSGGAWALQPLGGGVSILHPRSCYFPSLGEITCIWIEFCFGRPLTRCSDPQLLRKLAPTPALPFSFFTSPLPQARLLGKVEVRSLVAQWLWGSLSISFKSGVAVPLLQKGWNHSEIAQNSTLPLCVKVTLIFLNLFPCVQKKKDNNIYYAQERWLYIYVCIYIYIFFFFFFLAWGMQDLSSLT